MDSKFRVGQKVLCVQTGPGVSCFFGHEYTIQEDDPNSCYGGLSRTNTICIIGEDGKKWTLYSYRFRAVDFNETAATDEELIEKWRSLSREIWPIREEIKRRGFCGRVKESGNFIIPRHEKEIEFFKVETKEIVL